LRAVCRAQQLDVINLFRNAASGHHFWAAEKIALKIRSPVFATLKLFVGFHFFGNGGIFNFANFSPRPLLLRQVGGQKINFHEIRNSISGASSAGLHNRRARDDSPASFMRWQAASRSASGSHLQDFANDHFAGSSPIIVSAGNPVQFRKAASIGHLLRPMRNSSSMAFMSGAPPVPDEK